MCELAAEGGAEAVYRWRTYYQCGHNRALILFLLACVSELQLQTWPEETGPKDPYFSQKMRQKQARKGLRRLRNGY